MEVVIYYETAEPDTVSYILEGNYRYMRSHGPKRPWDAIVHRFFTALLRRPVAERADHFEQGARDLRLALADKGAVQGADELLMWMDSRAEGCPLQEIFARDLAANDA